MSKEKILIMNIKYTKGIITPTCDNYSTLILYNNEVIVYKATIPLNEIDVIVVMNKNIINEVKG